MAKARRKSGSIKPTVEFGKKLRKAETDSKKVHQLSYELIGDNDEGGPIYAAVADLISKHHDHLAEARIAIAWHRGWNADKDGRLTLGKCRKASDLDRELAAFDFVIILNYEVWHEAGFGAKQQKAVLDHELCHAGVKMDAEGETVEDAKGRTMYRIVKHDLEEFSAVVRRHGIYKKDLATFAQALLKAKASPMFSEPVPEPEPVEA